MIAVRMTLEERGLAGQSLEGSLVFRSDNGAQPGSKRFVEYLGRTGLQGQCTGCNALDANAFVERVTRTLKSVLFFRGHYDSLC
jgi:transposase InsO family protein